MIYGDVEVIRFRTMKLDSSSCTGSKCALPLYSVVVL